MRFFSSWNFFIRFSTWARFQDPAASLNERATVDYIISEGLYNFHLFENEADRVRKVEEMIEEGMAEIREWV